MIGYWHFMKIWRKSTNISGLSDIKQYNKTKMHSFSQFKPFSKFVYFLGALSFTSAVNKWNRDWLHLPFHLICKPNFTNYEKIHFHRRRISESKILQRTTMSETSGGRSIAQSTAPKMKVRALSSSRKEPEFSLRHE